jgi:hypothetical protein
MRALPAPFLRAASAALRLLGAVTAVYFLIHLIPEDPATAILLVVLSTSILGGALVERLSARCAAR